MGALFLILALAAAACSLPSLNPQAPCSVTRSPELANQLVQRISSSAAQPQGGPVTIKASNDEVSSLLEQSIQQGKQQNPQNTIDIANPVVCFSPGQMQIFGNVRPEPNVAVDALVTLTSQLQDGRLDITVQSVQVGPVPLPDQARQRIQDQVNNSLNQYLQYLNLTQVQFDQGQMTLTGTLK